MPAKSDSMEKAKEMARKQSEVVFQSGLDTQENPSDKVFKKLPSLDKSGER